MVTTGTTSRRCDSRQVRSACCGAPLGTTAARGVFPWRGRGWPSSAAEERQFVSDLVILAGGMAETPTRSDVTALMNALRSGIGLDALLDKAPGLHASRLLGAARDLESRRLDGVTAWNRVLMDRTACGLLTHGPEAGHLLPALMTQLELLALERPGAVTEAIDRCERRAALALEMAQAFETRIATCVPGCGEAARMGARLYDPEQPSAWSDVFYVPQRLTDLVPERVTGLLRERAIER
jgi:hypothetical protein